MRISSRVLGEPKATRRDWGVAIRTLFLLKGYFPERGLHQSSLGCTSFRCPFHLVCEECEQVVHHAERLVEEVRSHLLSGHGFTARRVDLHVSGRCARCSS